MNTFKYILGAILISTTNFSTANNVIVYRWVDSNNVVHFSQHQPKHDNYIELQMSNVIKAKTKSEPAEEPTQKQTLIAEPTTSKCEEAKANVQTLQDFEKIQYTNANGDLQVLTDKEKSQQLEINKKQVEVYCQE